MVQERNNDRVWLKIRMRKCAALNGSSGGTRMRVTLSLAVPTCHEKWPDVVHFRACSLNILNLQETMCPALSARATRGVNLSLKI